MNRHCLTIFPFFPHSESKPIYLLFRDPHSTFWIYVCSFLSTDVGFINFNDTRQKIIIVFVAKSVSYSLKHKPSGLLRCTDHFSQLNA